MKNPLVSIVIPCFNAQRYVCEAIDSALNQTWQPLEVVVVDDGSTDDTFDILRSYGDRIRCLTGPNRGGSHARNVGIRTARGEVIQFLDADDLIKPDKLERQVPVLLSRAADIVYCSVELTDMDSGKLIDVVRPRPGEMFRQVCFDQIQTSAPVHFRSDLLQVGGFREGLPCAQEKDLHIRLAAAGFTFSHMDEQFVIYRQRKGSVSGNYQQVMEQFSGIVAAALKVLKKKDTNTDDRPKVLAELLVWSGRQLARIGALESAIVHFEMARTVHPSRGLHNCSVAAGLAHRWLGPRITLRLIRMLRSID